jgi:hypothetical protein
MSTTYIHDLPTVDAFLDTLIPVDVAQNNGEYITGKTTVSNITQIINASTFKGAYITSPSLSSVIPIINTNNIASGYYTTISGGTNNSALSSYQFIGGGRSNRLDGNFSVSVGGVSNFVVGSGCFIGGGDSNIVYGSDSAILGGISNALSGDNSFIVGSYITGIADNTVFVNNLSATGTIYGNVNSFITVTDYRTTFNVDDGDNGTIVNVDTSNGDVYAVFSDNLTEGLNVTLNNIGTNSLYLSSSYYPISASNIVASSQFSAFYVYLHNDALYAIIR